MTTANKITIFRIVLVPFFIVQVLYYVEDGNEWNRFFALLSFAVASISDGLDGYIARRYHQRSELGAILDPLADKLLLVSAIVILSLNNHPYFDRFPLYLAGAVLGRDMILLIGSGVIYYFIGKVAVRPRLIGKIATVFQMMAVIWALLKWDSSWLRNWIIGATLCTIASGLLYILDGVRQLSISPSSSAIGELEKH